MVDLWIQLLKHLKYTRSQLAWYLLIKKYHFSCDFGREYDFDKPIC